MKIEVDTNPLLIDIKNFKDLYDFFVQIPEEKWCKGSIHSKGQYCAVGHLICRVWTDETAKFVVRLNLAAINDAPHGTAKQNILDYLKERM